MTPAVFLDRDGTIIIDRGYLKNPDEIKLLEGSVSGLQRLQQAGYLLVLITNQSGIGRGYFGHSDVAAQHQRLAELLDAEGIHLDAIKYCPHAPEDQCACRKPSPAMLEEAAAELAIDCSRSYMIGDKMSDVEAGERAGGTGILIADARSPEMDCPTVVDLAAAADLILARAES